MKQIKLKDYLLGKREELGLTQAEMAIKLGVSRVYYVYLENGAYNNPSVKLRKRIADITGAKPTEIKNMCGGN